MAVFDQGYALVIGVGADLPNTVDDAQGLADILRDPARCAYPPDHVHLLGQDMATRQGILAALDELAGRTDAQSTVVVYFSGHGYRAGPPADEAYYLMPYGYDLDRLDQTAVSGAEFADRLQAIGAQKLLLLLDCCHAGGIGESQAPGRQLAKSALPPEARRLLAEGSGRVIIASSQEDELSFAGKPYSAFTLAVVEALSGVGVARQDGTVRVADLALHAREVVPGRTGGRQHPILHFEQADNFALAFYAGGETQPKGVPFVGEPQIEPEPGAWTLSGTFHGPVAAGGGDAVDMRGAPGAIYKPAGPVEQHFGPHIRVDGDLSGKMAIGNANTQISFGNVSGGEVHIGGAAGQPAGGQGLEGDWAGLWGMLADLRRQIEARAPVDRRGAALERTQELQDEILSGRPDQTTVDYVCRWFARNLPDLADAVHQIATHPVVRQSG